MTNQETDGECISALVQGVQIGTYATDQTPPDANFGAAVDGNYGFGDGCTGTLDDSDPANPVCTGEFAPLAAGDYLVSIEIPKDAAGRPMYQVTREEDINVGRGDQVVPQVPPPACVGALHTVDVEGDGSDSYSPVTGTGLNGVPVGVTVAASAKVHNPPLVDMGGSPYEGMAKPECDTKLVGLNNGKSIVPMFNIFTDVPIPSRLRGLIVDDLNYSTDKRTVLFGDKAGVPNAPVGIYDFANDLKYTAHSDYNGFYDVLMPSTDHINCPTPSGVCQNMYRFVGNDPGVPGALNADYNPRFRTIGTEFEAMPGVTIPTDLAPTQVGVSLGTPGTSPTTVKCMVNPVRPQLFSVNKPFATNADVSRALTIKGLGFGANQGTGAVRLTFNNTVRSLQVTSWSDTEIVVQVPRTNGTNSLAAHPYDLTVTADNGLTTTNGLTFHLLGAGYNPNVREVGPGVQPRRYDPTRSNSESGTAGVRHAIQNAIDDSRTGDNLIVVYPNTATTGNPRGAYYENLVVTRNVKLQGVGAGGFQGPNPTSPYVNGTVVDGSAFGGDTDLATDWFTKVGGLTWAGNQTVSDGSVFYLIGGANSFSSGSGFLPTIDGFDIRGGDQQGFPGNINDLTGQPTGLPPNIVTQGGAIFANAYVHKLQITNNVVENNGGGYGTIRIGTPDLTGDRREPAQRRCADRQQPDRPERRHEPRRGHRALRGLGRLRGLRQRHLRQLLARVRGRGQCLRPQPERSDPRQPDHAQQLQRRGRRHHDRRGAPGQPERPVTRHRRRGDRPQRDQGQPRQRRRWRHPVPHGRQGHDAGAQQRHRRQRLDPRGWRHRDQRRSDVRIYDNTIMDNITTATAVTSNGQPAPAGVSTSENSQLLQADLPAGSPAFSKPVLFNNILWNNRAGTRAGTTVTGIGLDGDTLPVDTWDVGVADGTGLLDPTNSVLQQNAADHPYTTSPTNRSSDPKVVEPWPSRSRSRRGARTRRSSTPTSRWSRSRPTCSATTTSRRARVQRPRWRVRAVRRASPAQPASARDIDGDPRAGTTAPTTPVPTRSVSAATPPAGPSFLFSTAGSGTLPGVGAVRPGDILHYDGALDAYSRVVGPTATVTAGIPASANIDGFASVDGASFYVSFAADTTLPGIGAVQDEDVAYWNGSRWSLYFDGTAEGMTTAALDVTSISFDSNGG